MSRIGNNPITVPSGVTIAIEGNVIAVSGSKGRLQTTILPFVTIEQVDNTIVVKRKKDDQASRSVHGLTRSLISNMMTGVTEGWTKNLELVGVGYRAQGGGNTVTLSVGYSHPVVVKAPEGINFTVTDTTKISVSGIDKQMVGQIAANIRATRPPEVYKGKGVRYSGEYVRRKAGKAGKAK